MNEDTEYMRCDARLLILMQWLKDNDESGVQQREHANNGSKYIPDLLDDTHTDVL